MYFPSSIGPISAAQASPFGGINAQQLASNVLGLRQQAAQTQILPQMLQQQLLHSQINNQYLPSVLGSGVFANEMGPTAQMMNSPWMLDPQYRNAMGTMFGHVLRTAGDPNAQNLDFGPVNSFEQALANKFGINLPQSSGNPGSSPPPQQASTPAPQATLRRSHYVDSQGVTHYYVTDGLNYFKPTTG